MGAIAIVLAIPLILAILLALSCLYFLGVFVAECFFINPYNSRGHDKHRRLREGPLARCVRVLFRATVWAIAGYVCAFTFGIANMFLFTPPDDPQDELANEWYFPVCVLLALEEAAGGAFVGSCIGAAMPDRLSRWRVALAGFAGAVFGTAVGWFLARRLGIHLVQAHDATEHVSTMLLQAVGACAAMLSVATIATARTAKGVTKDVL